MIRTFIPIINIIYKCTIRSTKTENFAQILEEGYSPSSNKYQIYHPPASSADPVPSVSASTTLPSGVAINGLNSVLTI